MSLKPKEKAEIGIIGGSGIYDPGFFENSKKIKVYTPYGMPSDFIIIGNVKGRKVAFLARHGTRHVLPPHKINYRANIWALKQLGVTSIISVSAVGSLRMDYKPGDFVCPDQFIDMTKSRNYTFYDGHLVCHFSMADPFCKVLRKVIIDVTREIKIKIHERGTYLVIEGPRFSTRAESKLWRNWGADIVGMTLVPEVVLAKEIGMCYANISMITDYDVWAERPVTAEEVVRVMNENVNKAKKLLYNLIPKVPHDIHTNWDKEFKESCIL